jgi:hypothetical protein
MLRVECFISIRIYRANRAALIYAQRVGIRKRTSERASGRIHKIDRREETRARSRETAGLIVNCKQFRNCVDKAIKPFDRSCTGPGETRRGEASRSVTNTSADVITAQTESDNAIWIIHDNRTTSASARARGA